MNLRTLALIAFVFALGLVPSSARAQGVGLAIAADQTGAHAAKLYDQAKAKAGSCGANMYWKKGKCNDARAKK